MTIRSRRTLSPACSASKSRPRRRSRCGTSGSGRSSENPRGGEPLVTQPGDIFGRGAPEETAVLPAELRRTQVADAPAGVVRLHVLKQHQTPGFVQAEDLLV